MKVIVAEFLEKHQINQMRKVFYVLAFTVLSASEVFSQSLSQQVVGVTGNFIYTGSNSLSFTVGEAAIETFSNSTVLTQGFQQPDKLTVTEISEPEVSSRFEVFPNPAQDNLFVKHHSVVSSHTVTVRLTDILGRNVFETTELSFDNTLITIPMKDLSAGTYLLNIADSDRNLSSYKIIKIQ